MYIHIDDIVCIGKVFVLFLISPTPITVKHNEGE